LIGKIQQRYGIAKEEAQKQVDAWEPTILDEPRDLRTPGERKAG
jgi:hypothetical protein